MIYAKAFNPVSIDLPNHMFTQIYLDTIISDIHGLFQGGSFQPNQSGMWLMSLNLEIGFPGTLAPRTGFVDLFLWNDAVGIPDSAWEASVRGDPNIADVTPCSFTAQLELDSSKLYDLFLYNDGASTLINPLAYLGADGAGLDFLFLGPQA